MHLHCTVLLLCEQFCNLWLFKDIVVLYVLYVHCTHVRSSYVINFYLLTYLLSRPLVKHLLIPICWSWITLYKRCFNERSTLNCWSVYQVKILWLLFIWLHWSNLQFFHRPQHLLFQHLPLVKIIFWTLTNHRSSFASVPRGGFYVSMEVCGTNCRFKTWGPNCVTTLDKLFTHMPLSPNCITVTYFG